MPQLRQQHKTTTFLLSSLVLGASCGMIAYEVSFLLPLHFPYFYLVAFGLAFVPGTPMYGIVLKLNQPGLIVFFIGP